MKTKSYLAITLAVSMGLSGQLAKADDIEIYLTRTASLTDEPMVMFSIDYRPNLAATVCNGNECDWLYAEGYLDKNPATETIAAFDLYRAALKVVLEPLGGLKVGFMINHDDGSGPSCAGPPSNDNRRNRCTNGGYIVFGFRSLQVDDGNGAKAAFHQKLGNLPLPQGNESHKYQGSELFFELFRYLTGGDVYNGHNGWQSFDGSRGDGDSNIDTEYPGFSWDTSIETANAKQYISPLASASDCAKISTINFMFGTLNDDGDSDRAIEASKAAGGMGGINLPSSRDERFEAVLSWLRDVDLADGTFGTAPNLAGHQHVTSYFLVPAPNRTENDFARAGGTQAAFYLSTDPDQLIDTLKGILYEVLSVSTTFVSASVPVNVFNRSQVLDNVYIALFEPKITDTWSGNVKKLIVNDDDPINIFLEDATGALAVANDGRIKYEALTFWTDVADLPFPDSNVTGSEADFLVNGKDGRFVPRGGAGQQIAGIKNAGRSDPEMTNTEAGARQLFTQPVSGTTLVPLNADTSTATDLQTDLGASTVDEAECLLAYARGYDVVSTSSCNNPDIRSWLMGDPLHSRPLPINYGGDPLHPDIRIIVGGNDGFLRMIRNTSGSLESGKEVWAFMPREVMPILSQLMANRAGNHPYGVDGAATAYVYDNNRDGTSNAGDGDKVWVFFGLRRGGKAYYALDISNPDNPRFMWSIDHTDSDFSQLGLTFSQPKIGMLDWGSGEKPVVVFGGGYDANKDRRSGPGTDDSEGNALFVVDAETGDLVWKVVNSGLAGPTVYPVSSLVDSIPSTVSLLDFSGDGLTDRVYVGDTGGVLWRADFPGTDRLDWTLKPILSVGRHAGTADRRFFHAPDVALSSDDGGAFDAVIIGSGDRANPLERTIVNELYMLKDRNVTVGAPPLASLGLSDLADLTDNCLQDEDLSCAATADLNHGWRISLEAQGEKSLATPLTLGGTIFFTTYRPPTSSGIQCGPSEGGGALYAVKLQDATATRNQNTSTDSDGGGILQKEDRLQSLDSGGIPSELVVLPLGDRPTGGVPFLRPDLKAEIANTKLNWKTFWYQDLK